MIVELLVALQAAAPPAPAAPDSVDSLVELAKLLGTGGATTFALLAWQALRHERTARRDSAASEVKVRADRQRELDGRLERMGQLLARIEERTGYLVGEMMPAPTPPTRRERTRTPPGGVRTSARKPTESDE